MTRIAPAQSMAVRAPKTAELIAERLRSKIVRGELAVGQALPSEGDLTRQFGVSRPTLREAFRILETESLIVVRRGARGGARVTRPEASVAASYLGVLLQMRGTSLADIHAARRQLEPPCAAALARTRTKVDLADLGRSAAAVQNAATQPAAQIDGWQWSGLVLDFHRLVLQRAGNTTVALLAGVLGDLARDAEAESVRHPTFPIARFEHVGASCAALVELLARRQSEAAEQHWVHHFDFLAPLNGSRATLVK